MKVAVRVITLVTIRIISQAIVDLEYSLLFGSTSLRADRHCNIADREMLSMSVSERRRKLWGEHINLRMLFVNIVCMIRERDKGVL